MSDKRTSVEVKTTGPAYLSWRGALLAELALARVPGLIVHKRPERSPSELPYGFLAATENGLCFFVDVKAFSSMHLGLEAVDRIGDLRLSLEADAIRRARESLSPVVLFLFDADGEHGRYLRLDTLPVPSSVTHRVTVRFPIEATLTTENLENLIAVLQRKPTPRTEGVPLS